MGERVRRPAGARRTAGLSDLLDEVLWGAAGVIAVALAQRFIVGPVLRARTRARLAKTVTIEWERIAGTREREEQVDLIDEAGKQVGWINLWNPDAPGIMRNVVNVTNRVRPPEPLTTPHTMRGSIWAGQPDIMWLIYAMMLVPNAWLLIERNWGLIVLLVVLVLVPFLMFESAHVLRTELTANEVVVHYPWKQCRVARSDVDYVSLTLEPLDSGAHRLVTQLHLNDTKPIAITPNGADHLASYRAVFAWLYLTPGRT